MEEVNLKGSDKALKNYDELELFSVGRLKSEFSSLQVVDIRSPEAFLDCHVPQSISISKDMLGAYGGYFLNYSDPILFIAASFDDVREAKEELKNLGYDNVRGFLNGGVPSWETSGEKLANLGLIGVSQISEAIENSNVTLLDVRKPDEWQKGIIENARTIFLGNLLSNLEELDEEESIITYCGSGKRATIAASLLQANGYSNLKVFMGSMKAYEAKENK